MAQAIRFKDQAVQTDDPSGSPSLSETESVMEHERALYMALGHEEDLNHEAYMGFFDRVKWTHPMKELPGSVGESLVWEAVGLSRWRRPEFHFGMHKGQPGFRHYEVPKRLA